MKKIYISMIKLPTLANTLVYIFSGFKYSHFSICLDNDLKKHYSFQVRNRKTPLVGGFIEENESYFFHGKKDISLDEIIFEIPVSDVEYANIKNHINNIKSDNEYIFNYISSLFMFTLGGFKVYKSYHCCEFISEILLMIDGVKLPKKSYKMRPKELYKVLSKYKSYKKVIKSNDYNIDVNNAFFKNVKLNSVIAKSYYTTTESIIRLILKRPRKNFDYYKTNFYKNDFIK